jgi:hypothetical protein
MTMRIRIDLLPIDLVAVMQEAVDAAQPAAELKAGV